MNLPVSTLMSPNIVAVQDLKRTGRKLRKPTHTFSLRTRPWQIQPFLLAPVLPGETMKNLLLQARVVTDPIVSPLVGWWTEYYFFYVKLTDLDDHEALKAMLVTGAAHGLEDAAATAHYYAGEGINFSDLCLKRVVDEYFRDEDETYLAGALDAMPLAAVGVNDMTDSLILDSATADNDHQLPGENPELPPHMAAFQDAFDHWEAMRAMQLEEATFDDWLKTFGVKAPQAESEDLRKPELIRYCRKWSYPSNTIDPATGAPSSAVSWAVAERADKDRFCQIPGFIFGVTVARPKVYFGNLRAASAHYLDTPYAWLPAVLHSDPYTSLRKFVGATGPLGGVLDTVTTDDYWIDVRDLFIHGEQFVNYTMDADTSKVSLPSATATRRYATSADADALFVGAAPANTIRQDGRVDLAILSRVSEDHSG